MLPGVALADKLGLDVQGNWPDACSIALVSTTSSTSARSWTVHSSNLKSGGVECGASSLNNIGSSSRPITAHLTKSSDCTKDGGVSVSRLSSKGRAAQLVADADRFSSSLPHPLCSPSS